MLFLPLGAAAPPPSFPICLFSLYLSFFFSTPSRINRTQRWAEWLGASGGSIFDLGCTLPLHDSWKSRRFPVTEGTLGLPQKLHVEIIWLNSACAQVIELSIPGFVNIQNT